MAQRGESNWIKDAELLSSRADSIMQGLGKYVILHPIKGSLCVCVHTHEREGERERERGRKRGERQNNFFRELVMIQESFFLLAIYPSL